MPNAVFKRYTITTGVVLTQNSAAERSIFRGFELKKNNGEIVHMLVWYGPIYKGDKFEVIYLPNTRYGAIIRKIENGEN